MSRYLTETNTNWKTMKNAFPGVINDHKLYYSVIESRHNNTIQCFKIMEFDFETLRERIIVEREEQIPKMIGDLKLLPIMGMLSVYFHIDKDTLKYDEEWILTHDQFL